MIIYRYEKRWEAKLIENSHYSAQKDLIFTDKDQLSSYFLTCGNFISLTKNENEDLNKLHSSQKELSISELAKYTIQKVIDNYDQDDCIHGLFNALSQAKNRISPFIATRHYCFTIQSCSLKGKIIFNVSPIYHLGPEYPEQYRLQYGTSLDNDAIIGLTQQSLKDPLNSEPGAFSLGIDAGIVFKNSKIPHNQMMILCLKTVKNGLMTTLTCDTQTTSRKFSWEYLGLEISKSNHSQPQAGAL